MSLARRYFCTRASQSHLAEMSSSAGRLVGDGRLRSFTSSAFSWMASSMRVLVSSFMIASFSSIAERTTETGSRGSSTTSGNSVSGAAALLVHDRREINCIRLTGGNFRRRNYRSSGDEGEREAVPMRVAVDMRCSVKFCALLKSRYPRPSAPAARCFQPNRVGLPDRRTQKKRPQRARSSSAWRGAI